MRIFRTALAWKNLSHNPVRFLALLAGIAFAVVLMFIQLGFRNALLDSTVEIIRRMDAEIVLMSRSRAILSSPQMFPRRFLSVAKTAPGVSEVWPMYLDSQFCRWAVPPEHTPGSAPAQRRIRVIALDPTAGLLRDTPEAARYARELESPGAVLFDRDSKAIYGPIEPGTRSQLSGHPAHIVGQFRLGTDFVSDGTIFTTPANFAALAPSETRPGEFLDHVDLGLIRIAPGHTVKQVTADLRARLPEEIQVLSREGLSAREEAFWLTRTPVGLVFNIGLVMGFIVGVVICYQILYSEIEQNTAEYATLKAIGYNNRFLVGVVARQALLLSLVGFVPGLLVSLGLYRLVAQGTGLLMRMSVQTMVAVLSLTIVMCLVSACAAIRKLFAANPAELF